MIKVLSLCAALLAPVMTGEDPHGRAAHLSYNTDFDTAYGACIATAGKAQTLGLDIFTVLAMTHKLLGFSPPHAERKRISRRLSRKYGCRIRVGDYYVRDSCSPYMLLPQQLYDILHEPSHARRRYETSICYIVSGSNYCRGRSKRLARRIKYMSRRFVSVYRKTHAYYEWTDPYIVRPPIRYRDRRYPDRYSPPHDNHLLRELYNDLDYIHR